MYVCVEPSAVSLLPRLMLWTLYLSFYDLMHCES